jgi:hypothetical protein
MQFTTKNSPQIDLDISYANKIISKAYDTKFLGIYADNALSWKYLIEQITHRLSADFYTVRSVKPFMSQETMKIVDCAYCHSIINYGLIFWGNFAHFKNF